jgi:hypothetical protein
MGTYEHMLEYYHGMCKDLCVKWDEQNVLIRKSNLYSIRKKNN